MFPSIRASHNWLCALIYSLRTSVCKLIYEVFPDIPEEVALLEGPIVLAGLTEKPLYDITDEAYTIYFEKK